MKKNAIMYCCRSEKHVGHMQRSIEVARKLSDSFDVTILVDDEGPMFAEIPESVRMQYLPALPVDPNSNVFEFGRSEQFKASIIERRNLILESFEDLKPRLIIDNFPFNNHRLERIDAEASDSAMVTAVALLQREFQAAYRELDNRHPGD